MVLILYRFYIKDTPTMLDKEFQYYLDHQSELVVKYDGKYLIIKGDSVLDVYDTKDEAYFESEKKYELGTYLIQHCARGNMFFTQTFYSQNVAF